MPSLTNNPEITRKLIDLTLQGESTHQIASEMGVNQSTVSRALNKPQVRTLLEKAYLDLASLAPQVYDNYKEEIEQKPVSIEDRKLRLNATKDVAAMIGLSPVRDSHNNVFFTQIIAPVRVELSPVVAQLLGRILGEGTYNNDNGEPDWIEAESE
jgi:hypothetical protein